MTEHLKHRKSLNSKTKKKDIGSSASSSSSSQQKETKQSKKDSSSIADIEIRLSQEMNVMFSSIMDRINNLSQANNSSISAPSFVPGNADRSTDGAGGNGGQYAYM